jgi:purine-nucleoside/S-methyl-5'-thioadenosine phosphorylase / adenosine deaminase
MGRTRGSGKAGQQGDKGTGAQASRFVRETSIPGKIPRFEIPGWRERYHVIAGITGRGSESGRGCDLGLWSNEPVGEVMSRWLGFRREMSEFPTVALGNQVHGVEIMSLDAGRGWIQMEGIDGWITRTPGILLTVTIADCIPVYLVAPGRGIGLLHAGWRGTARGILGLGLERLAKAVGGSIRDVVMHCGVGICGHCYEVGSEVMQGCGVTAEGGGPWHLDLRHHLMAQARAVGLSQVTASSWCSAHDRPTFYSHRASRGNDGRMVAYIGISPAHAPAAS